MYISLILVYTLCILYFADLVCHNSYVSWWPAKGEYLGYSVNIGVCFTPSNLGFSEVLPYMQSDLHSLENQVNPGPVLKDLYVCRDHQKRVYLGHVVNTRVYPQNHLGFS